MMKSISYLGLFAICLFCGVPIGAAELRIPANTAYFEPNADGAHVSDAKGITDWNDPGLKITWFGELKATGKLTAAVALHLKKEASSKLRLTVAGQTYETNVTGLGQTELVTAHFGEFDIPAAGYQRFTLESLNAPETPFGSPQALVLDGPAIQNAHFNLKSRRNAASVHLAYPVPANTKTEWFYSEVTALEDPVTTFYMACGFHRGYFGMQVNSPTERRIIFSVWDAGKGSNANERSSVEKENYVSLIGKGPDVHTSVFGGEGTGGHSHLKYLWKTGETQKFLVTASPTDATHTIYSGYYYHPEKKAWMLISSMQAPKDGGYLKGLHGFSENFGGSNGQLRRKALYGNQWIRTADKAWNELTTATFSHDETGKADRLDRFMGVENQQFFLSHGGFIPGFTKYGTPFTREATKKHPEIVLPGK
ncbi:MAG: hypothetical protein JWM11_3673 [Planctomycetaceae bacterium]|nr:hypothetical protein [Planctomycetaceae bacterium]